MRYIKLQNLKNLILLAAALFTICGFHPPAIAQDAFGPSSCEVTIFLKNAAGVYDDFVKSSLVEEFSSSRLFTRYGETIAAGKIEQLKRALDASFSSSLAYDKALAFFSCPAVFYIIDSDLDALKLLLAAERDISKFEYFAKFKKGVKSEKYLNSTIYSIVSEDGIESLYFCGFNSKTFFSNDIELLYSIISKKINPDNAYKSEAPLTVNINLEKLNAKLSDIYKKRGSETLYIYPDAKAGLINIAAYNGSVKPQQADIQKALDAASKINVPEELAFAACAFELASADFFALALKYAEKFEMPSDLKDAIKSLAGQSGKGFALVIGAAGDAPVKSPITGSLSVHASFGFDKCDGRFVETLGKYLNGCRVEYISPSLIVSQSAKSGSGQGELQWARNFNASSGANAAYFYYLKFDDKMAEMAANIIGAALSINSWQGSNAYELMSDLSQSQGLLKSLEKLFVIRLNGIEGLNSVIKIKLR